ncbi:hypothetical protein J6590_074338 [Homalodisca vitripennis]|nr:hypothetical protein J6590_074338 [Homalodisca vitripennis]
MAKTTDGLYSSGEREVRRRANADNPVWWRAAASFLHSRASCLAVREQLNPRWRLIRLGTEGRSELEKRGDRSGTPWWRRQPPHAHPHPYKLSHAQAQMPL